MAVKATGLL